MKKTLSLFSTTLTALTLLTLSSFAQEGNHTSWGYTGHSSPETWGNLSAEYHECNQGFNQSPIDVRHSIHASLVPLELNYSKASKEIVNNGHTIQVNMEEGDNMVVDDITFDLKQFHFHTPSENHIEGKAFPLEAHFVHLNKEGRIAVLAVMFEEGKENATLAKLWQKMPKKIGQSVALNEANIVTSLLPKEREYYRFNGSLTTPPCTEGVRWLVLKTPITVSKEQVELFLHTLHHANNRPIQSTNARMIVE